MRQTRAGTISPNVSALHKVIGRKPGMIEITCRCRSGKCGDAIPVPLPGGKEGWYHPDFKRASHPRHIEVKRGVGYNLDTLFQIAGAVRRWGSDYEVRCDETFVSAWTRYASEVPRLRGVHPQFRIG